MLTFQHDLYQLGRLFDQFTCELPDELKDIRALLLSAPSRGTTAKDVMAHPYFAGMMQEVLQEQRDANAVKTSPCMS
jgi:hypothetical protein